MMFARHMVFPYKALTLRGKGGVFRAIDLSSSPPTDCIVKAGTRNGDLDLDRRDGRWRVLNERKFLTLFRQSGINVPGIRREFEGQKSIYLVMECARGMPLNKFLTRPNLSSDSRLGISKQIIDIVLSIHSLGFAWRDIKPSNFIVSPRQRHVTALDFEGVCRGLDTNESPWGSPSYTPPEWKGNVSLPFHQDLYALGMTLYDLWRGKNPNGELRAGCETPVSAMPSQVWKVINGLTHTDPASRLSVEVAASAFRG